MAGEEIRRDGKDLAGARPGAVVRPMQRVLSEAYPE